MTCKGNVIPINIPNLVFTFSKPCNHNTHFHKIIKDPQN